MLIPSNRFLVLQTIINYYFFITTAEAARGLSNEMRRNVKQGMKAEKQLGGGSAGKVRKVGRRGM